MTKTSIIVTRYYSVIYCKMCKWKKKTVNNLFMRPTSGTSINKTGLKYSIAYIIMKLKKNF